MQMSWGLGRTIAIAIAVAIADVAVPVTIAIVAPCTYKAQNISLAHECTH